MMEIAEADEQMIRCDETFHLPPSPFLWKTGHFLSALMHHEDNNNPLSSYGVKHA